MFSRVSLEFFEFSAINIFGTSVLHHNQFPIFLLTFVLCRFQHSLLISNLSLCLLLTFLGPLFWLLFKGRHHQLRKPFGNSFWSSLKIFWVPFYRHFWNLHSSSLSIRYIPFWIYFMWALTLSFSAQFASLAIFSFSGATLLVVVQGQTIWLLIFGFS